MINYSFKIFICAGCSSDNHQTFSQKLEGIVVVFQLLLKSNPPNSRQLLHYIAQFEFIIVS